MPAFICNRWPSLTIGARIKFQAGLFETEAPELIALIEANDAYGVHIHPRDLAPAAPPAPSVPSESEPESEPRVRSGRRGTR